MRRAEEELRVGAERRPDVITNLVALLIVTNAVRLPCKFCDRDDGRMLLVMHEHQYEQVVTTNYLPVVVDPRMLKEGGGDE